MTSRSANAPRRTGHRAAGAASESAASLAPYVPGVLAQIGDRSSVVLDGTMVSADISGFTALSERLGQVGREGAEELTAILNDRFTQMIDAAHRCGGDILKFGGDAILVLFTGDGHPTRAVVAAKAMRSAVDRPVVSDLAGRVQLQMSIGAHAGEHHLFVAEPDHRELIVTGPGPTACVRAESAASAGQILVTQETAARLDPAWFSGGDGAHVEVSVEAVPEVIGGDAEERRRLADELLTSALPLALRQRVQAGTHHGEHRLVSMAFLRFSNADAIITEQGPFAFSTALGELCAAIAESSRRYGVHWLSSDVNADGGKIILTAGAPISTGHDETAVLRAVRDIADADQSLDLHIGVNRGRVFVADLGAPSRRSLTIMGDPVNLAARLTGVGRPGQIVATTSVLDRCEADFDCEYLDSFHVKGRDEPVEAALVGPVQGARSRYRFHDTDDQVTIPLVGRKDELGQLLAARLIAEQGEGQVLELVGPAGSGKTRLLRELSVRSGRMRIFTAAADPYMSSEPLALVRPMIRQVMGATAESDAALLGRTVRDFAASSCPEILSLLPLAGPYLGIELPATAESESVHPSFRRTRAIDVVTRLAEAVLDEPALFLIEDVHEADAASIEVLRGLFRGRSGRPWLFCLTRHDGTERIGVDSTVIELCALPEEATRELIRQVAPAPMTPAELDRLTSTSDGNPLFAIELATIGTPEDELPESLESLLAAQLDRLPPAARLRLSDLAVLGVTADHDLVDAVVLVDGSSSRDEATWRDLRTFLDPQSRDGVSFRHSMVCKTAYETLAFARRRELHQRAAEMLADRPNAPASVIARHFASAARHDEAFQHAVVAADIARRTWATEEAISMYRLALEASARVDGVPEIELGRLAEALGDTAEVGGRFEEAQRAYRQARKQFREHLPADIRLQCKLGGLAERHGKYSSAVRWYQRVLRELDEQAARAAEALRVPAEIGLSGVRYRQGRYLDAISWAERAEADAMVAADDSARARAGYLQVLAHTYAGSPDATRHRERVSRAIEAIDDILVRANCYNNLGIAAYFCGDWDECLGLYELSAETFERAGDPTGRAYLMSNIAEVLSDRGELAAAEASFREARSTLLAVGYTSAAGLVLSNLGRTAIRAGRVAEGIETQRAAITELDRLGAHAMVAEARARLAEALVAEGSFEEARVLADELLGGGPSPTVEPLLTRVRAVSAALGDRAEALRQSIEAAVRAGSPYEEAIARSALHAATRACGGHVDPDENAAVSATLDELGVSSTTWDPTVRAAGRQS